MASKKKSKAKDPNPSNIEMHSDDEEVKVRRNPFAPCLPRRRGSKKQAIDSLRPENERLIAANDSLSTENESLKEEIDGLQRQVQQLQIRLEKEKTEREKEMERREEENKRRKGRWQEELQQSQEKNDGLQRQVQQLQTNLEKENTEREEEEDRREEENKRREERWEKELKQSQEEKFRLQRQVQELQTQLKNEKTEREEENKRREEENKRKEERRQKELKQSQAERDSLQREMRQLQTTLQAEKTAREKENKDRETENKNWEKCWQQTQQQHQVEIRTLREDITAKTAQIGDYKHRLSEMASERMRQGNACVEDLNDPFRPTALADKWTGLFKTGEYWTAYDKAQNTLETDEATAQFLYNVTRTAWKICFDFVEDFVPKVLVAGPCSPDLLSAESEKELCQLMLEKLPEVRRKLEELLPQDASRVDKIVKTLEEECNNVRQTDIPNLQQKLRKAVSLLPKTATPPALLAEKVAAAVHEEENSKNATVDENFLRKLTGLCYLMRLQEVPLSVNFDFTRGSPLDQSMFEVESSASQPPTDMAIKSILRPPLLRSAGGAVLSKGEADVEPAKPASDSTTQDKVQSSGTALGKQNGDKTAEPKGNELDERNNETKQDESNQNEAGGDGTTGVKDTSTNSTSQDGTSDQDKTKENSANASQTNPDDHEEKRDQDEHEKGSGRDKFEEASNADQNNARGSHADKNNVNVSLD